MLIRKKSPAVGITMFDVNKGRYLDRYAYKYTTLFWDLAESNINCGEY